MILAKAILLFRARNQHVSDLERSAPTMTPARTRILLCVRPPGFSGSAPHAKTNLFRIMPDGCMFAEFNFAPALATTYVADLPIRA